jgi:hypothetical protein
MVRLCSQCVLPENFPGVQLDDQGVCNYCQATAPAEDLAQKKSELLQKFETLLAATRGRGNYDALLCYSGGKDSTYTLGILKEKFQLRVLALTVDNGFLPAQTLLNIPRVMDHFGVDHLLLRPNFQALKAVFSACCQRSLYSAKTLERASAVCTACMAVVKAAALRLALEKEIPFIAFGWSPGQAPLPSALMKNNPQMVQSMQKAVYAPLQAVAGDAFRPFFLEERHFQGGFQFPTNVHPLAFLDYNEEEILRTIQTWGWEMPPDTDANSTNCQLNSLANVVHRQQFGYNPYVFEMSKLVREGYMHRSFALEKVNLPENERIVQAVRTKLGIQ